MQIARVIVELSLNREFDYRIPASLEAVLEVGDKVSVPFGNRHAEGFVVALAETSERTDLKAVSSRIGDKPLVTPGILALARWMADYYACPIENAVRTVLPGVVRRSGAGAKERLLAGLCDPPPSEEVLAQFRARAPKQARALDLLREHGDMFAYRMTSAGVSNAALRALANKGHITLAAQKERRNPFARREVLPTTPLPLMPQQTEALALVVRSIDTLEPPVVLLHGVTGSGKTEIYLQAMQHALERGKGAIVLVPEISLTPQTVERFRGRFGDHVAVLHSSLSDGERHDEWHRIRDHEARIVIGARSALFAPVRDLGLIVVDEEHEPSYKQEEAPRYNARDVAVMRGHMEKCAVVLGSATPALESRHNCTLGKYAISHLLHRVDHREMPRLLVVDMRKELQEEGKIGILSRPLVEAMRGRLDRAEQTILFLNRRGYASSLLCPKCGEVVQCDHCSVSMTYHRQDEILCCHLCGEFKPVPQVCPACRDPAIKYAGLGTQRVESVVAKLFPCARISRMDADTTRGKDAHDTILTAFRMRRIDILIGTQMIAKGLDFPGVTLVGVINADTQLHLPDFRAGERTFQLLTQVSGRAGRGEIAGEVVVQTFTPFHAAVQLARTADYEAFYAQEIEFRRALGYPPFTHLVCLHLSGPAPQVLAYVGEQLVKRLRACCGEVVRISEPAPAPIARARRVYRYQVMMRAPRTAQMTRPLRRVLVDFKWPPKVRCSIDVDANSLL